jgi:polysaccharide biosynthesis protein PslH
VDTERRGDSWLGTPGMTPGDPRTGAVANDGNGGLDLRILVVTPYLPFPPEQGFALRAHLLVRVLSRRHAVTILAYATPGDVEARPVYEDLGIDVRTVVRSTRRLPPLAQKVSSLLTGHSYRWQTTYRPEFQAAIDETMVGEGFDAVQLEAAEFWSYRYPGGAKLVLDAHNVWYEIRERLLSLDRVPIRRQVRRIDLAKARREEHEAWERADLCLMTSEREGHIATRHGARTVAIVPNGVDIGYLHAVDAEPDPDSIVFTGLISYRPNTDGVHFLVRDVMPRVWRQRPNAVLTVVGKGVPPSVAALAGPRVKITGWVPDIRPYLSSAAVAVAPLRAGSGTRIKIIEAFALARPVVSTTIGCEGLDVRSGEHLLVADDADGFADGILAMLSDRSAAQAIGRAGRALLEREYTSDRIADRLEDAYRMLEPSETS